MAISSSVVLPRALTGRRRRAGPSSRARTMRAAARLMRSASATEVPPNFMTTVPGIGGRLYLRSPACSLAGCGTRRARRRAPRRGSTRPPLADAVRDREADRRADLRAAAARARRRSRALPASAAKQLPLRQRIAQLMVVGFEGTDLQAPVFGELAGHGWGGISSARRTPSASTAWACSRARRACAPRTRATSPPLVAAFDDGRPSGWVRAAARRAARAPRRPRGRRAPRASR